jgi:hypothetical protein
VGSQGCGRAGPLHRRGPVAFMSAPTALRHFSESQM